MGVGAAVVAAAVYFGMRFQHGGSLANTKAHLHGQIKRVAQQFTMDISNAIRVKGHPDFAPAVYRVEDGVPATNLRVSTDQFDHIRMYVIHEKSFSAPIRITGPVGENSVFTGYLFEADDSGSQSDRFLKEALIRSDIFLVSNPRASFLIRKEEEGYTPPNATAPGELTFKIMLRGQQSAPNIDYSSARIQAVKKVEYQVKTNRLEREVEHFHFIDGVRQMTTQRFGDHVKQFHVNWFFADRRHELFGEALNPSGQVVPLNLPLEPLSAPVYSLESRLAWTDISAAQIDMELESEKSFSSDEPLADSMCRWAGIENPSKLICRSIDVASAADFEELLIGSDEASVGAVGCLLSDKQSRCKPSCDYRFTSTDRNSLAWEGYKAGSDYCTCRGDVSGGLWPGEPGFSWPSYVHAQKDNPSHRLNACIRSFFVGCDDNLSNQLRDRDPRLAVACFCIHPYWRNHSSDRAGFLEFENGRLKWPPISTTEYSTVTASLWENLENDLREVQIRTQPYDTTPGGAPPFYNPWRPPEEGRAISKLRCGDNSYNCWGHGGVPGAPVRSWLCGPGGTCGGTWPSHTDTPIHKYCGCLTHNTDSLGRPSSTIINWWTLTGYRSRWTQATCPNLILEEGAGANGIVYRVATRRPNNSCNANGHGLIMERQSVADFTDCGPTNYENNWFSTEKNCYRLTRHSGATNDDWRLPRTNPSNLTPPSPPEYTAFRERLSGAPSILHQFEAVGDSYRVNLRGRRANNYGVLEQNEILVPNQMCTLPDCMMNAPHNSTPPYRRHSCCLHIHTRESDVSNFVVAPTPNWSQPSDACAQNPSSCSLTTAFPSGGTNTDFDGNALVKNPWRGYCTQSCPTTCDNLSNDTKECANLRTALYFMRLSLTGNSTTAALFTANPEGNRLFVPNVCYGVGPPPSNCQGCACNNSCNQGSAGGGGPTN
jgi:hypothetical protein